MFFFINFRLLASRVALDSQGRLILRESGKIILPFEHFANAVMLKHMNGPHGLHLSLEATIRAVSVYYKKYLLCGCSLTTDESFCHDYFKIGCRIIYYWSGQFRYGKRVYYRSCTELP